MHERRVVVAGYDGIELVDVASVTSCLAMANRLGATPAYAVRFATLSGGAVRCDSGLELSSQVALQDVSGTHTLVVSGGLGHAAAAADGGLLAQVQRLARSASRVASVCTGASVLAAAGLLDGRRATTHWHHTAELAAAYPAVRFDPAPIFVRDDHVWTSGGVTAALDLTLAFVEADHGAELARWVAMGMVTYLQRPGNQAQMSMFVRARRPEHAVVRRVLDHVTANPGTELSTARLAAVAGVSERHLTRLLVAHAGQTPARLVRQVRLEAAATALVTTDQAVSSIAKATGFRSGETLRQAFSAWFGISPTQYRTVHRRRTQSS
ncbi:DJ-1/PfpI family protein [Micromonospora sp. DR5-3]|uniref:GlxA family transcriptional regulator n=1 Tax=unclassified Micromonospora TaxID=2617518 RepID=UPI0011D645C4|nr:MULTISPECIES: helix-turn-helix domain-containing protein [unclassified Micromonospora]MCW3820415.1 DJ-1/PfpI family protein [Micromonospora sp. DR5-3]TYC19451.1 helix-turn-helix domain-containing protein [Micromonospora sp. MP36]